MIKQNDKKWQRRGGEWHKAGTQSLQISITGHEQRQMRGPRRLRNTASACQGRCKPSSANCESILRTESPWSKWDVMNEITCNKSYIGATGQQFSTWKTEHQRECEKETSGTLTRATLTGSNRDKSEVSHSISLQGKLPNELRCSQGHWNREQNITSVDQRGRNHLGHRPAWLLTTVQ